VSHCVTHTHTHTQRERERDICLKLVELNKTWSEEQAHFVEDIKEFRLAFERVLGETERERLSVCVCVCMCVCVCVASKDAVCK
jgi:hypothetical protein